jgi:hypothetical protein
MTQSDLKRPNVTIGDSHSTAFADAGSAVLRTNGATLYGVIKSGSVIEQIDALGYEPERVTLVYGSIDIRHHIARQSDPEQALEQLVADYVKLVKQIKAEYMCEVDVAAPVPVEFEGRRIPKTGFYKDTAFAGSREDRLKWTLKFIELLKSAGIQVVCPPAEWYAMDPELYASTVMELSSSVHIAPMNYRRFDWGAM